MELIPDTAPFSPEQRAWLNGFLAGMIGLIDRENAVGGFAAATHLSNSALGAVSTSEPTAQATDDEFPWHDSSLPIADRMKLAEGKPIEQRLMAAMAQLDCGTCGYLCKTYAAAIANGSEKSLNLCSPGGSDTARMLRNLQKETTANQTQQVSSRDTPPKSVVDLPGTRNNPVTARLTESAALNCLGSAKDTRHVVIDLKETNLKYRVGDALGIYPSNCDELVQHVIEAADLNDAALGGQTSATPHDILKKRCLRTIPVELVERAIVRVRERTQQNGSVAKDAQTIEKLETFLKSNEIDEWDVCEFLEYFPELRLSIEDLKDTLPLLRPRLYSIASSQSLYQNEVHLTIGRVEKTLRGRSRKGVASTMFADRLKPGDEVKIFLQPSHGFTVPEDGNVPMIMVGPGTGIAPFIAFLQQRKADKANGKNWLFFGDQRRAVDFLYQDQLESWVREGHLSRLDLAFSRDDTEKVYVQHRMKENGTDIWSWLQQGSHFYVCGDAARMAVDVDRTLHEIVALHGKMNSDTAKQYVANLVKSKRYVRDVY